MEQVSTQKWQQRINECKCVTHKVHHKWGCKTKRENDFPRTFKPKVDAKEDERKKYPFFDSDVFEIFDELHELKLIKLSEMKRPDEAGKFDDPNYCKYHRLLIHPLEKCFVFKDRVMRLANENKIILDDEKASSN